MKLYRGVSARVWTRDLVRQGWPLPAAKAMAAFLVGEQRRPPEWWGLTAPGYWADEPIEEDER